MVQAVLDLDDIQGDILAYLQKNAEIFVFFKIVNAASFKQSVKQYVISRITSVEQARQRDAAIERRKRLGHGGREYFYGLNLGFTKDGITQLCGAGRPKLDPSFERGADHQATVGALHDPPSKNWLPEFLSDRIDGVFLITGPSRPFVTFHRSELLRFMGNSIKVVYSELGETRPGAQRGHEHFGFLDGISQPGVRGVTRPSSPMRKPDQGLPGQDLIWPGEFVFGYPGQNPDDMVKPGAAPPMATPWLRNGSYMVFRRLEQKVPEFRKFVAEAASRLGMDPELLAARMVGRWKSGAPMELAPLRDDPGLGRDPSRNNDFEYAGDPDQRRCPYAGHIRKMYPRDDMSEAEVQTHRIIRSGIPFGPELLPGETTTARARGLMFVCYQTSIGRQFEWIQKSHANDPDFVAGKKRPADRRTVRPGFDPIVGQAEHGGPRQMDEPFANYPAGNRRTTLEMPDEFVKLTAAAYFFVPSITALRRDLT